MPLTLVVIKRDFYDLWPKIELLTTNRTFDHKLNFWPQIELLTTNWTFDHKSNFWPKIEILTSNRNFEQKTKRWPKIQKVLFFVQNSDCWSKLWFWSKFWFLLQKFFLSKFEFLDKISIFGQNLNFWTKFRFLVKIWIFGHNLNLWSKCRFLVNISIFGQTFYFWSNFRFFVKLSIFCQPFDFLSKFRFFVKIFKTDLNITAWIKSIELVKKFQHGSLNFSFSARVWVVSLRPNCVNFVHKDDRRGVFFGDPEQLTDQFWTIAEILLDQFGSDNTEECG